MCVKNDKISDGEKPSVYMLQLSYVNWYVVSRGNASRKIKQYNFSFTEALGKLRATSFAGYIYCFRAVLY